jgi:putative SOS response-associated peptidase YedK
MPGRYAVTSPPEALRGFFRYVEQPDFPPRYNIAPTQPVPVVRLERAADGATARHFVLMRWGFLPGFVKEPKTFPLLINARSESMAEKPSFRNAVRRRRCLFIADCYYEWDRHGGTRRAGQAYLVRRADGAPFGFAGLWEDWAGADGSQVETACIVTVMPNGQMAAIHDRMPAIVEPADFDIWLSLDDRDTPAALRLMRPARDGALELIKIGDAINKVANDGPRVQAAV